MDTSVTEVKPAIEGYRNLTAREIRLINEMKLTGNLLQGLVDLVKTHVDNQHEAASGFEVASGELNRLMAAEPYHWIVAARKDLQSGIMKLTRAVAQPSGF
jgi:predicted XRE-type DNA-binding protein